MRVQLLALTLASSLSSPMAFAESAGAPCNVMDQQALDAFNLGDYKMTAEQSTTEHKKIPEGPSDLPTQITYTCTYTPKDGLSPSLTVTTAASPHSAHITKPACSDQLLVAANDKMIPGGMAMTMCSTTAKNNFLTFILMTNASSADAMKSALPAQVERLVNDLATANQH
ncbi:hypothetical protein GJ700_05755 [Duganella sp. FT92W]|uniref:DUF3558 domain-containing protein n=1 Tax=Pseudoduganella rivuli TaxID=2666085 RepID=A0A7X2LRW1_9BURK|nr:hypothetical protein [Pseudoduganella rivuli]MRV71223.1 hypothetical protein [Pseudoduganella rivuli]